MLFNSFSFLFIFLPIVWGCYIMLRGNRMQIWLLVLASLVFYGVWDVAFLPIIAASILLNYALSYVILSAGDRRRRKVLVALGIAGNLATLAYFKYTNFFIDNVNMALGAELFWPAVVLPIGISFFTFQQCAFLVDTYRNEVRERNFGNYALFVSFFPQLIAGPIVHHKEMMPQFADQKQGDVWFNLCTGLTLLTIGLAKKVLIADTVSVPSSNIFNAAALGDAPTFLEAWTAAVAYSFQIYFDFSAYSDMAVGLGRLFGINLPINFASPYKATSITDFWRRWHITLSRFLRDYLYIPLGGNRKGVIRQDINLMATMLLGGIWHGAGWTFLLWGGLHGLLLLMHRWWRTTGVSQALRGRAWWTVVASALTLLAVVFTWVPFRAESLGATLSVWAGMIGLNGIEVPQAAVALANYMPFLDIQVGAPAEITLKYAVLFVVLFIIVRWAPNAYSFMQPAHLGLPSPGYPATDITEPSYLSWKPNAFWACVTSLVFLWVILELNDASEFIYFQF